MYMLVFSINIPGQAAWWRMRLEHTQHAGHHAPPSLTAGLASSSCLLSLPSQDRVSEFFPHTLKATSIYCLLEVGTGAGAWCCGNNRDSESR